MKRMIRLATVIVSAGLLGACGDKSGAGARAPEARSTTQGGCPDEDPFCHDKAGDIEDTATSSSKSAESSAERGGPEPEETGAKSPESPISEIVVVKVAKPVSETEAAEKEGKEAKEGKAKAKEKKAPPKPPKPEDGKVVGTIVLHPKGLSYSMSSEQIAKLYDRLFDAQYLELFKKTPVGPQTEALDAELAEKKRLLRQNRVIFGNLPTGIDNTPLKNEYTYQNNESMTRIDLGNGLVRNFFFFNDRLWKIYDEHTLGKSPLGKSWESAILYLTEKLGNKPKLYEPGPGREYATAEWSDGTTLLRLVNRDFQQIVGVVFIEQSIQNQLPSLRKNRKQEVSGVDSSVAAATRPKPPPEPEKKGAAKKKQK